MNKINQKVERWLNLHPSLKDDDLRLCSNIWNEEIKFMGYNKSDFLKLYSLGKLTSAPSIKRARAKLQKEKEELRGEKYNLRQGIFQEGMKIKLGYQ